MANYPVYRFIVKEDGTTTGMVGIALVDEPAVEAQWMTFAKQEVKPVFIALESESKQELLGVALRPDFPILRKDEDGSYYYGVFEKQTIETIKNKFHKEKRNLGTVNLMHDSDQKIEGYLNESYIIQTQEQLDAVRALGLAEDQTEIGDWVVRYKIEDSKVFNFAKENLTGFSIEILLERELVEEFNKNNIIKNNKIMSKIEKLVERFKTAINEFEEPVKEQTETPTEQTLEDVTVAESQMVLRYTEVGAPVLEVTSNEEGAEETVAAAEGEYILEDGRVLVIDAESNLVEIRDAEQEVEPVAEEDMTEEENLEAEKPADENLEEDQTEKTDLNKTLSELIPVDSDGTYQLEVYVSEGKISFGTLYAYTYKDLKFDKLVEDYETLKQEKVELDNEVEKLKAEVKKPVSNPVFTQFNGSTEKNKISKTDFKNNLEYTLHRLGLDSE